MAVPDSSYLHGLKLVIKDYPYAMDRLEIWEAIETWVTEYRNLYYTSSEMVKENDLKSETSILRDDFILVFLETVFSPDDFIFFKKKLKPAGEGQLHLSRNDLTLFSKKKVQRIHFYK